MTGSKSSHLRLPRTDSSEAYMQVLVVQLPCLIPRSQCWDASQFLFDIVSLSPKVHHSPNRECPSCVFIIYLSYKWMLQPSESVHYLELMSMQRLRSNSERNLSQNFGFYLNFITPAAIHTTESYRPSNFFWIGYRFGTLNIILSQLLLRGRLVTSPRSKSSRVWTRDHAHQSNYVTR